MDEDTERGSRLKESLGERSNAWLAKQVGVVASTVHGYVHGKVPPADVALRICDVLGIDLRWYINGGGVKKPDMGGVIMVPVLLHSGEPGGSMSFAAHLLKQLTEDTHLIGCVNASGAGMAPTIPEYSEVLFLHDPGVIDGKPHVLKIRERIVVRRVVVRGNGVLETVCDNPAFVREAPDVISPEDVLGRVLWVGHIA
jgi:hypothetical protein